MKELQVSSLGQSTQEPLDRRVNHGKGEKSFGQFFKESIEAVNQMQSEANRAIESLASGETKNIHETMIAMEKAEVSFKLMTQVRNKILEAYNEVMRMAV